MKKRALFLTAVLAVLSSYAVKAENDKSAYAVVNGDKITKDEISKRIWRLHSDKTLQDMIDERLILQEAKNLKINPDKKELDTRLNGIISTYGTKEDYEKSLKNIGMTQEDLKEQIKRQILIRETIIKSKNISVTEKDAQAFFDQNKDRLGRPESVKLRQVFVKTSQEADDAHVALAAGADFAKLAALKSADENLKKNAGDLRYVLKGTLIPEIEKEVFSLKSGQFTKPIQTGNGFSILKVEDLKPSQPAKFEEVKNDIILALTNQLVSQRLPELITELRQKAKIKINR